MLQLEEIIDAKDLELVFEKAKRYANFKGYQQEAEDFAQECVLYAFQKETDNIYLSRRLVDYLRKTYGHKGFSRYAARFVQIENLPREIPAPDEDKSSNGCFADEIGKALERLTKYERLIYVLSKKYTVAQNKIADCVGVSEPRIGQELKRIQKTIDQTVARKEPGVSELRERKLEEILAKKRKRLAEGSFEELATKESFRMESYSEASF